MSCSGTPQPIYKGATWRQMIRNKTRDGSTETVRDLTGLAVRGELRIEPQSAAVFAFDSADGSIEIEAEAGEITFVMESTDTAALAISGSDNWFLQWEFYDNTQSPPYVEGKPIIRVPVNPA